MKDLNKIYINADNLAVIDIIAASLEISQDDAVSILTDLGLLCFSGSDQQGMLVNKLYEAFGPEKMTTLFQTLNANYSL